MSLSSANFPSRFERHFVLMSFQNIESVSRSLLLLLLLQLGIVSIACVSRRKAESDVSKLTFTHGTSIEELLTSLDRRQMDSVPIY